MSAPYQPIGDGPQQSGDSASSTLPSPTPSTQPQPQQKRARAAGAGAGVGQAATAMNKYGSNDEPAAATSGSQKKSSKRAAGATVSDSNLRTPLMPASTDESARDAAARTMRLIKNEASVMRPSDDDDDEYSRTQGGVAVDVVGEDGGDYDSGSESDSQSESEAIIDRWSAMSRDRNAEGVSMALVHPSAHSDDPARAGSAQLHLPMTPSHPEQSPDEGTPSGQMSASPSFTGGAGDRRSHRRNKSVRRKASSAAHSAAVAAAAASGEPQSSNLDDESSVADSHHRRRHHRSGSSSGGASGGSDWKKLLTWKTIRTRLPYYIPCLSWIPSYPRSNLLGDIVAGLSIGTMLVPQGLTYAALANLPPIYGLYTAFFPLLVYVLLGSSKHLSVGPEITSAILIGKTITQFPSVPDGPMDDPAVSAALVSGALALSFTIGLVSLILGLTRLGFLDSILSKPMLAGFVLALAATLMCEQMPTMLGITAQCGETCKPGSLPGPVLIYVLGHVHLTNWRTFLVALACCSFMIGFSWLKRRFPAQRALSLVPDVLIVVVVATFFSYLVDLHSHGVVTLGRVEYGFQAPAMPTLQTGSPSALISTAVTICMLGFVETQLVNKKYASKHQYMVSANRELVALGTSAMIGSIFGAFVAFGSLPRTKVSDTAGVKSQMANFVAAMVTLSVIVWLLPHFSCMPKAVAASIIFVVAISLIDVHELLFCVRTRSWVDLGLLLAMSAVTFGLGVDIGIFFAFAACLLMAVKQTTLPGVTMLGRSNAQDDFHDLSDVDEEATNVEGILIYKIDGPLYFANAEKLKDSTKRAETQGGFHIHPSEEPHPMAITAVVLDLTSLTTVDASALMTLVEIISSYRARNARVCLVKLRKALRPVFEAAGIIELVGPENCYRKLERAVADVQAQNLSNLDDAAGAQGAEAAVDPAVAPSLNGAAAPAVGSGFSGGHNIPPPSLSSEPASGAPHSSLHRHKKSMFTQAPLVGSPLLRGMTKMKM